MRKEKLYRYLGRNGILDTKVLLDGINHIDMIVLYADPGYVLTNGEDYKHSVLIEASELKDWKEIADNMDK